MKIKNKELVNSLNVLGRLNNAELTVKASYKLAKNIKNIEKELNIFNDEKQKLINKYSEKDEEGKNKINEDGTISTVDADSLNRDYNELLEIEADVKVEAISIDELAKSDLKISAAELSLIDYMIK